MILALRRRIRRPRVTIGRLMLVVLACGAGFAVALPRLRPHPRAVDTKEAQRLFYRSGNPDENSFVAQRAEHMIGAVVRLKRGESRGRMDNWGRSDTPGEAAVREVSFKLIWPDRWKFFADYVAYVAAHPAALYDAVYPKETGGSPYRDLLGEIARQEVALRERHRGQGRASEQSDIAQDALRRGLDGLVDEAIRQGVGPRELAGVIRSAPDLLWWPRGDLDLGNEQASALRAANQRNGKRP